MDGITAFPGGDVMPPPAPLPHPVQDLGRAHRDPRAPGWLPLRGVWWRRAAAFLPAFAITGGLARVFADWLSDGGMWWLEWVLLVLVAATFFWVVLSLGTAALGLACQVRRRRVRSRGTFCPLDVALVVPVYNEETADVFGNACAMMTALREARHAHRFHLYILSDTQDAAIALAERRAYATLRAALPPDLRVWYRRRLDNSGRKVGNLRQWLETWGGAHDAMLVLDADSLMSAGAITALADEMAADAGAGLIQTAPLVIGSDTLFGRMQQFAGAVYGTLLSAGLAAWSGAEGNYWGHNAILRTRAFADCAGLPRMPTLTGRRGALILSHDFVEAALLRRSGWSVRFVPGIGGSYEEPPATLIDYALRDRRWCHGNLQHLRLLGTRGLHIVSRFHLLHGAMSYLLSPAWFILLVIWALLGNGPDSVISYFSAENPLYPVWPEMSGVQSGMILLFMYAMLLAPKAMGALAILAGDVPVARFGGAARFSVSLMAEIVLSILFAPVMMVQQVVAVLRTVAGIRPIWSPQARKGGDYGPLTVLTFHALETASALLLGLGIAAGLVSLWLAPIALSLGLAAPLSMLSGRRVGWLMSTPEMLAPPDILQRARQGRALFRAAETRAIAAE
jgi:membrane glycosyltransferase